MSVTPALLILAAAAMLVMSAPMLAQAANRQTIEIVRSASQLAREKSVRQYEDVYAALTSGRVIYKYCAKDLAISQKNQDFLGPKIESIGQEYLKAFESAYFARMGASSPAELSEDYVNYLTVVQKQSMANTLSVIQYKRQGCFENRIRKMVEYIDKLRQISELPADVQAVAAATLTAPPMMVPAAPPKKE